MPPPTFTLPGSDNRFVGPFAEYHLERSNDNRFTVLVSRCNHVDLCVPLLIELLKWKAKLLHRSDLMLWARQVM